MEESDHGGRALPLHAGEPGHADGPELSVQQLGQPSGHRRPDVPGDTPGGVGKKLLSFARWVFGGGPEYCRACEAAGKADDCAGCEARPPELELENLLPWEIFQDCGTQWRYREGRPVGLDYNVVLKLVEMRGAGVEVFARVRLVEQESLLRVLRADQVVDHEPQKY
ncbi:MAG: DUF1799 domain-containing protein [Nitrospirae bacterium]|nr:DUF1799 domain-containing protein [Nitrospirota bacterium]